MSIKLSIFLVLAALGMINSLPAEDGGVIVNGNGNIIIANGKEFHYLGQLKLSKGGKAFEESNYYVSVNPASWNNAQRDCKSLRSTGHLLAIETLEERDGLNQFLDDFGSGEEYWTGGRWSTTYQTWMWSTGTVVNKGLINVLTATQKPTKRHGLTFKRDDIFTSTFRYVQDSLPQRYICEV